VILDADVLIDLLRELPQAEAWLAGLETLPGVSGMAALEVVYGSRNTTELRWVERFLAPFQIYWPSESDAQATKGLARFHLSDGIELTDVVTASIALRHGLPLATFNIKHYRSIPGLSTIEPYSRT
jgi:predicted nucleic acid-binding protein